MLLKTRREFTLCFFLFVPLGMAGYCADVKSGDSHVRSTTTTSQDISKPDAETTAASKKGGQPSPQSPAGGISATEQLTRLLVDGRRAYRDGEIITAQSYFRDALKLDSANAEAQKYLREIQQRSSGAQFAPDALSAQIPAGSAAGAGRVDVVGTIDAVRANATPAPLTQSFSSDAQVVSVAGRGSMSLGASNSFSRPVSIAVSLDGSEAAVEAEEVQSASAEQPVAEESVDPEAVDAGKTAMDRLGILAKRVNTQSESSARKLVSEASLALKDAGVQAQQAAATAARKAEEERKAEEKAEREAAAAAQKAEEERLAAEAAQKAEDERKAAEAKAEEEKRKAEEIAALKAEAEKAEREKAERLAAEKAEEERKAAEAAKKAEEKRLAAEAAKKAEEDRKAAKAEAERKAEEARQLAEAEKAAKEAEKKAEEDKRLASAAEERKQFNRAVTATNEGISLYNSGKYTEAKAKFEEALGVNPDYREAKNYMSRTERKLEQASASSTTSVPALNLDQLNDDLQQISEASAQGRQVADATAEAAVEVATDAPAGEAQAEVVASPAATEGDALPSIVPEAPLQDTAAASLSSASDTAAEATSLDVTTTSTAPNPPLITREDSGIGSLLTEGRSKFESGQYREALTTFEAVLEKDPENAEAMRYVSRIEVARAEGPSLQPLAPGGIAAAHHAHDAEAAFQQGLVAYQAGRLEVAVQHWNFALTLDSNHPRAIQYIEQTRGEYEAWVQQHQHNAIELQKEIGATNKLETGVTYDSAGQKTLVDFLQAMSFITDINFYIADGVDPDLRITAKFDSTNLQDALDIVLLPIGLKWHRTGDVVSVTTDLHNKFYNLTPDQVRRLKPLLENRTLQRYLYGPEGLPPMRNVELLLDDRENMLIVTDSYENLSKIEAFLKDLQVDAPEQLVFKNWKIRPEEGNRIKALVEAIVKVNSDAAWDLDRRVLVDGDDLIVKDSPDNIARIEQLLLDKNFLTKLKDQTLAVQNYSLIPREPIGPENVEQARDMAQSIVTVVKTILYSQSGEEAAAAEGRRFWYDPNTLQLTITDMPDNLSIVSDYLKSLPTLSSSEQKSEIIWLKHQTAPDMKGLLEQVLGLNAMLGGSTSMAGNAQTKTLRTEGQMTFGDLHIRVREVRGPSRASGSSTQNQRSATLIVRTATNSQELTLNEFDTEFIDEYEITADEIRPSGMDDGEGSIRLRVAVSPGAVAGGGFGMPGMGAVPGMGVPGLGGMGALPIAGMVGGSLAEELTMVIEAVPSMNALLIRYRNPADLDEVRDWLRQLDVPVMQVSIETKLVEVNETRAKEFMPQFNWANIGHGSPDFSQGTNFFDFANNDAVGELGRSPFDPFPETPFNAGLLKGSSVFGLVTGGESPISFTLRALESEGVVNLTNGPTVTVENGETADFQITRDFGLISERIGESRQDTSVPRLNHVVMSVSPQITQAGEIRLEITDLQLNDFGNQLMNIFPITIDEDTQNQNQGDFEGVNLPPGLTNMGNVPYEVRRRQLSTVARVKNHGTIVLGGWMGERSRTNDSGVPILRNLPYVGKLLFGRTSDHIDRTNLLIFLTCHLVDP